MEESEDEGSVDSLSFGSEEEELDGTYGLLVHN